MEEKNNGGENILYCASHSSCQIHIIKKLPLSSSILSGDFLLRKYLHYLFQIKPPVNSSRLSVGFRQIRQVSTGIEYQANLQVCIQDQARQVCIQDQARQVCIQDQARQVSRDKRSSPFQVILQSLSDLLCYRSKIHSNNKTFPSLHTIIILHKLPVQVP